MANGEKHQARGAWARSTHYSLCSSSCISPLGSELGRNELYAVCAQRNEFPCAHRHQVL
jgi:hypothetical protein